MSELTGRALAAAAAREPVGTASLMAAGRSSQAWLVASDPPTVVRVPIPNSGRVMSYGSEVFIGRELRRQDHPVAEWESVTAGGRSCMVGQLLEGSPIEPHSLWDQRIIGPLASTLRALHSLPATGFGPLADDETELRGTSKDRRTGICDRWFHTAIWPFDHSDLADHVVQRLAPDIALAAAPLRAELFDAESGPVGVLHSDLHREHLLVDHEGRLTGLLDFGDAFVGAVAWDFALLYWYYGRTNMQAVITAYGAYDGLADDASILVLAIGLYKIARSPTKKAIVTRLRAHLEELGGRHDVADA